MLNSKMFLHVCPSLKTVRRLPGSFEPGKKEPGISEEVD